MVQICKLSVWFYDNTPTCCPEVLLNTESITMESRKIRDNAHLFDCAPCMEVDSHSWTTELVAFTVAFQNWAHGPWVPCPWKLSYGKQQNARHCLPTCYSEAPVLALPPIDVRIVVALDGEWNLFSFNENPLESTHQHKCPHPYVSWLYMYAR